MSLSEKSSKRTNDLIKLGMAYNGAEYIGKEPFNDDFNVHWTEISCDTDKQWKVKIDKLTEEYNKRKP